MIVPAASTAERNGPPNKQARPVAPHATPRSGCPYARAGLAYYRGQFIHWTIKRGAQIPTWRKPRNCADARYLAEVWRKRAYEARQKTIYWQKHRYDAVIKRLDRGMAGHRMAGTGRWLERYGRKYGVSPYFMAAVAATESTFGDAACGPGGYNAWGLGNCGSAWSVPAFGSWAQAIAYYARFLAQRWPGHSTPYSFRGYAACDSCWGAKTSEHMRAFFGVSNSTRYP